MIIIVIIIGSSSSSSSSGGGGGGGSGGGSSSSIIISSSSIIIIISRSSIVVIIIIIIIIMIITRCLCLFTYLITNCHYDFVFLHYGFGLFTYCLLFTRAARRCTSARGKDVRVKSRPQAGTFGPPDTELPLAGRRLDPSRPRARCYSKLLQLAAVNITNSNYT